MLADLSLLLPPLQPATISPTVSNPPARDVCAIRTAEAYAAGAVYGVHLGSDRQSAGGTDGDAPTAAAGLPAPTLGVAASATLFKWGVDV